MKTFPQSNGGCFPFLQDLCHSHTVSSLFSSSLSFSSFIHFFIIFIAETTEQSVQWWANWRTEVTHSQHNAALCWSETSTTGQWTFLQLITFRLILFIKFINSRFTHWRAGLQTLLFILWIHLQKCKVLQWEADAVILHFKCTVDLLLLVSVKTFRSNGTSYNLSIYSAVVPSSLRPHSCKC